MFNLDQAIADWRRRMTDAGVSATDALDELESHLRDDVEAQISSGATAQESFASGVARMGRTDLLKVEFDKIGGANFGRERIQAAFFTLAGIPNSLLEPNMNASTSNPNIEPRWASYTKAAVFLAPAIFLWTFSVIFLIPKLKQICREAGVALPSVYRVTDFLADHLTLIGGASILLVVLLEWRWKSWARYRRVSLGGAAFFLNAAALTLITLMVVFALLAAPALMHHAQ